MWTTLLTSAAVKIFLLIANKTMTKVEKNSGVIILNQKTLRGHSTEMEDLQNRVRQLESGQLRRRVSRRYMHSYNYISKNLLKKKNSRKNHIFNFL